MGAASSAPPAPPLPTVSLTADEASHLATLITAGRLQSPADLRSMLPAPPSSTNRTPVLDLRVLVDAAVDHATAALQQVIPPKRPLPLSDPNPTDPATTLAFHPTHCAPQSLKALPTALVEFLTLHPSAIPPPSTVLRLYAARPYLLSTPINFASSARRVLRDDRAHRLLLPHLDLGHPPVARPLLTPSLVLALSASGAVPCGAWHCAYASPRDGLAWSALTRGLYAATGAAPHAAATVLLVRDTGGHVFGGCVAAAPLRLAPTWQAARDFAPNTLSVPAAVFQAAPALHVYTPTGRNENLVYFHGAGATVAHGVGMGGQMDHFGWWVEGGMEKGHSRTAGGVSSTYGNPRLASSEEFDVEAVEVWVVDDPAFTRDPDAEVVPSNGKKSVLEQYPELMELFEMAGRKMYSKDVMHEPAPLVFDDEGVPAE
ncbi:hypothetical protein AMAG_08321 [Allomyces macrogynus ATCC 38327]|uniref:MTOR-associated protein MEAK7 n=1 Tax=Allomyces macrogynus (strain ATCC 38327) TaxID=578462 RepID=A0A0L0SL51_ALLM3|nr:hypothetical protein AMAG_08321 [Allomyces macrogynus ATCC 38327]|eukprot:KNE63163.1 hypothetical protein AMAG_08321 [Allomyces macrogynus ATCC 38327]